MRSLARFQVVHKCILCKYDYEKYPDPVSGTPLVKQVAIGGCSWARPSLSLSSSPNDMVERYSFTSVEWYVDNDVLNFVPLNYEYD